MGRFRGDWENPGAEVGRSISGAVKPHEKRGHKVRAPYGGYSRKQYARLIPIKRVRRLRDLAVACVEGDR